jgi:hypothetical protein
MRSFHSSEAVEELERQLELSLRQVEPNPEFIDHLHHRLTTPSGISLEPRQSVGLGMLLTGLSLSIGVLLVILMRQLRGA